MRWTKNFSIDSIVKAITLAAHALSDALVFEHSPVLLVLVVLTLIGMKNELCVIRDLHKRLVEYLRHHGECGMPYNGIADDILAVQIKDRREIELLSEQLKLVTSVTHF